jgi:hypothetical protein
LEGVARSSTAQKKGDSGSIVYYKQAQSSSPDHLYAVHLATLEKDNGYTAGSSANDMYNKQGIWYGGEPFSG